MATTWAVHRIVPRASAIDIWSLAWRTAAAAVWLCASVCAQAAALAGVTGDRFLLGVLSSISLCIVAWRFTPAARLRHHWGRWALAILITAGGMARYLQLGTGGSDLRGGLNSGEGSLLLALLLNGSNDGGEHRTAPDDATALDSGGLYSGVILWPEAERHTILVPPLPAMKPNLFDKRHANPLSIPHCAFRQAVASSLPWKFYDDQPAVGRILNFEIPATSKISQFDEATVAFRLHPRRADRSAKIAIERFVLVPR